MLQFKAGVTALVFFAGVTILNFSC